MARPPRHGASLRRHPILVLPDALRATDGVAAEAREGVGDCPCRQLCGPAVVAGAAAGARGRTAGGGRELGVGVDGREGAAAPVRQEEGRRAGGRSRVWAAAVLGTISRICVHIIQVNLAQLQVGGSMGAPDPNPARAPMQSLLEMWTAWEIQAVVAVSFGLQVILFFFAGIRRYSISSVLKVFLWLVYLTADAVAIYAMGHMSASLSKMSTDKHQLVAFWAPFLLLHLGGQDTITAYALEDNKLWLRHLLNMSVQVAATGYVLHKYIIADRATIVSAAVLVSVAGFVKYCERIWALKCASKGSNGSYVSPQRFEAVDRFRSPIIGNYEFIVITAESYHNCIFDPLIIDRDEASRDEVSVTGWLNLVPEVKAHVDELLGQGDASAREKRCMKEMYRVIEMQLGLAYDMLYTKAQVIHTWYGYLIRVIPFASCFGALVAFTKSKRDRYSTTDIVITFVLLGGACALEVASAFKVIGSTWTYAMLRGYKWDWLARAVLFARYHLLLVKDGRWSNSISQYDFISFCDSDMKLMVLLYNLGFGIWWYKIKKSHHTKHIKLSPAVKDFVWGFLRGQKTRMVQIEDVAIRSGYWARRLKGFPQSEELDWSLSLEFHNCVYIWHIATSTFLSDPVVKSELVDTVMAEAEVVNTLSNYMMYFLVQHPDILPMNPNARKLFDDTFKSYFIQRKKEGTPYQIIMGLEESDEFDDHFIRAVRADLTSSKWDTQQGEVELLKASILVRALLSMELGVTSKLEIIGAVWMEMLCYTATKAPWDFHARQLSNGGEFLTHMMLLTKYLSGDAWNAPPPLS